MSDDYCSRTTDSDVSIGSQGREDGSARTPSLRRARRSAGAKAPPIATTTNAPSDAPSESDSVGPSLPAAKPLATPDVRPAAVVRCEFVLGVAVLPAGKRRKVIRAAFSGIAWATPIRIMSAVKVYLQSLFPELSGQLAVHEEVLLLHGDEPTSTQPSTEGWPRLAIDCAKPLRPQLLAQMEAAAVLFLDHVAHNKDDQAEPSIAALSDAQREEALRLANDALQQIGNSPLHSSVRFLFGANEKPLRQLSHRLADKPSVPDSVGEAQTIDGQVVGFNTVSRACLIKPKTGGAQIQLKYDEDELFEKIYSLARLEQPPCAVIYRDDTTNGRHRSVLIDIAELKPEPSGTR